LRSSPRSVAYALSLFVGWAAVNSRNIILCFVIYTSHFSPFCACHFLTNSITLVCPQSSLIRALNPRSPCPTHPLFYLYKIINIFFLVSSHTLPPLPSSSIHLFPSPTFISHTQPWTTLRQHFPLNIPPTDLILI
jgi:hypothetical protein